MHSCLEKLKKGLALRDITNQTPHAKTIKKTAKKSVNPTKKTIEAKKPLSATATQEAGHAMTAKNSIAKVSKSNTARVSDKTLLQEIEYMPPNPIPLQFTDEKYKIDLSCIKPTSKGCIFTKPNFKNYLNDEFEQEEINFNLDLSLSVPEADDSFLYF